MSPNMLMDFMLMRLFEAPPGTGGVFEQWAAGGNRWGGGWIQAGGF